LVRLCLQDNVLTFTALAPGSQPKSTSDPISKVSVVLEQGPLTEQTLEEAVARTEDTIMPRLGSLPLNAELEASGSELAELAQLLPAGSGLPVSVASVEHLFNQLADHASGSAGAWRHPIAATRGALGLVVLREVMHHGGFGSVTLSSRTGMRSCGPGRPAGYGK